MLCGARASNKSAKYAGIKFHHTKSRKWIAADSKMGGRMLAPPRNENHRTGQIRDMEGESTSNS